MSGKERFTRGATVAAFVVIAVGAAALSASPAHTATDSSVAACADVLSPAQSLQRVAQNIRAAGGTPTAAGAAVLNAASTGTDGGALGISAAAGSGTPSLSLSMLATNANPVDPNAAPTSAAGIPTETPTDEDGTVPRVSPARELQGVRRALGSALIPGWCVAGFTSHMIWYCYPGASACNAIAYWTLTPATPAYGPGCSIVNKVACQLSATAIPGSVINAMYQMSITEVGIPGAPLAGDKWCSF